MNPVRVAIAGASGRMGLALLEAATQTEGVALGGAVDIKASTWGAGIAEPCARGGSCTAKCRAKASCRLARAGGACSGIE